MNCMQTHYANNQAIKNPEQANQSLFIVWVGRWRGELESLRGKGGGLSGC